MSTTFSARLNRLFDTVYPPGRGPHTSAEVVAALNAEGIRMSVPYLSHLRTSHRTNLSIQLRHPGVSDLWVPASYGLLTR